MAEAGKRGGLDKVHMTTLISIKEKNQTNLYVRYQERRKKRGERKNKKKKEKAYRKVVGSNKQNREKKKSENPGGGKRGREKNAGHGRETNFHHEERGHKGSDIEKRRGKKKKGRILEGNVAETPRIA